MSSNRYYVGKKAASLNKSPALLPFTKVVIIVGEDEEGNQIIGEAGDESGRVLETTNKLIAPRNGMTLQQTADAIAADMLAQVGGYVYRPFEARDAFISDDADLGDAVTMSDVYGVIIKQELTFDGLFTSSISAPNADETDNEFGNYTSAADRDLARRFSGLSTRFTVELGRIEGVIEDTAQGLSSRITQTVSQIESEIQNVAQGLSSRITQTAESITAEVSRATAAEGSLSTRITQNASSITAQASSIDALGNQLKTAVSLDSRGILISNATGQKFTINTANNISMSFANLTDSQSKQLEIDAANSKANSAYGLAESALDDISDVDRALTALKTNIGYTYIDGSYVISPNIIGGSLLSQSTAKDTRVQIRDGKIQFGYYSNLWDLTMSRGSGGYFNIMSDIYGIQLSTISSIKLDGNTGIIIGSASYGSTLPPFSEAVKGKIFFLRA